MLVTARERRTVLRLLNVSETARHLEIPIQHLHYRIRAGLVVRPEVRIGKRLYYTANDLPALAEQCSEKTSHP